MRGFRFVWRGMRMGWSGDVGRGHAGRATARLAGEPAACRQHLTPFTEEKLTREKDDCSAGFRILGVLPIGEPPARGTERPAGAGAAAPDNRPENRESAASACAWESAIASRGRAVASAPGRAAARSPVPLPRVVASLAACVLLLGLALPFMGGWSAEPVPPRVLRLHVIAHSDNPGDQALKLQVRDAILPLLVDAVAAAGDPDEAMHRVEARKAAIEARAREVIRGAGYPYGVRVEVGRFHFPARRSGDTVYPAGTYDAVRVVIGAGRGKNFWCVLFPGLCVLADAGGGAETGAHSGGVAAAAGTGSAGGATAEKGEDPAPAGQDGVTSPAAGEAVTLVDEAGTGEVRPRPRLLLLAWWEAGLARWRAAFGLAAQASASQ